MVVRGSACLAAIWTSRKSTPASSMVLTTAQHVRVHPGEADSGVAGEVPQPSGGGVSVHPSAALVEQQRTYGSIAGGMVDRSADGGW